MSEFSCLHGNERYAACDDESYTVTSRDFVCQSPNQKPQIFLRLCSLRAYRPQSPEK